MNRELRALLEKAAVAAAAARESYQLEAARDAAAECLEILERVLAQEPAEQEQG